jgi:hypothetical protein
MATNLRIGQLHAYQSHPEVEPVSPYPRVDPQQSQEEPHQQQNESRQKMADQTKRRYRAMRQLVNELKNDVRSIQRVSYLTAEQELKELGLQLIERELPLLLATLKIPQTEIIACFEEIKTHKNDAELCSGESLQAEVNPFPVFVRGLVEYVFRFAAFPFRSEVLLQRLKDENKKKFVLRKGPLALVFFIAPQEITQLWCQLYAQVGVCEIDDDGRRVIFYAQSTSEHYSLYADKALDFSI